MKVKKIISLLITSVMLISFANVFISCGRKAKFSDVLTIASESLPSNLMPYDSNSGTSTFIASHIYNSMLGSELVPQGYKNGTDYFFEDGTKFEPIDKSVNPYLFTDSLLKKEGAFIAAKTPNTDGVIVGKTTYTPTQEEIDSFVTRRGKQPTKQWLKYTFEIVEGRLWNDGTPFSAHDVAFTFNYIMRYQGVFGAQASFLTNYSHTAVLKEGKYLEIYLGTEKASDIKIIANSILILPKHIWENVTAPRSEKNIQSPVGTGAYKLASYIEGSSITLTQREDYPFKDELSKDLKNITIKYIGSPDTMLSALQKGDIDLIYDDIASLKAQQVKGNKNYTNVRLSSVENDFIQTLLFNIREDENGYFSDSKFGGKGKILRQAISLAINQQNLIDDILFGNGSTAGSGLVDKTQTHALTKDGVYVEKETDIDKANNLLEQNGFKYSGEFRKSPTGEDLKFEILASSFNERLVQGLKIQLKQIGIDISFKVSDNQTSDNIKYSKGSKFQMFINTVSFTADKLLMFDARYGVYAENLKNEPDFKYEPRLFNYSGILDKTFRDIIADMDNESDTINQMEKAKTTQQYLADLYIEIPLYASNKITAYSEKNFKGWVEVVGASVYNDFSVKYLKKAG